MLTRWERSCGLECVRRKLEIPSEYLSDWEKCTMDREGFTSLNKWEMMQPPEVLLELYITGL